MGEQTSMSDLRSVEGQVTRVVFYAEDTGRAILRVTCNGRSESWLGIAPPLQPGANVRARGRVVVDPKWGPQMQCESIVPMLPASIAGIEAYLASGNLPGIGPAIAKAIVQRFGLRTFATLDADPNALLQVPGIGPAKVAKIAEAWKAERIIADVMAFLEGHGASPSLAGRIVKRYGGYALHVVQSQPYRLALEVQGVGFKTADQIAQAIGINPDAPERAQAATLHVLGEGTQRGDCYLPIGVLAAKTAELITRPVEAIHEAIHVLATEQVRLNPKAPPDSPTTTRLVLEEHEQAGAILYPRALYDAEVALAARLRDMLAYGSQPLEGAEKAIAAFEREAGVTLAPGQREAVEAAARHSVVVVTGGPGTGKSMVTKAILGVFDRAKVPTMLASPTGRAAKRLSEATGKPASTIHRMLGWRDKGYGFAHDANNPLPTGALLLDEVSMADLQLTNAVVQALRTGARLVLVGDVDQLPSVGPGAVLRDIIASEAVPTVRLTRIYRQAEGSAIIEQSHRINSGRMPEGPEFGVEDGEFFFTREDDSEAAARRIVWLVSDVLPARYGFDPAADIQVLTPMHKGHCGTIALNAALQAQINPRGNGIKRGNITFREGDPVLQTKNDRGRDVYNGDRGRVVRVDTDDASLVVDIDGREVAYDRTDLADLTLAYATSVHKSQGSTIRCVLVALQSEHYMLLSRGILYTGVTRAERLCILVANPRAVQQAVRETRREVRRTRLADRLRGE